MDLKALAMLIFLAWAPVQIMTARNLAVEQRQKDEELRQITGEDEEGDDDDDEDEDEDETEDEDEDEDEDDKDVQAVDLEDVEGGTLWRKDEDFQINTKLRFRGNKIVLKKPELEMPNVVKMIKKLQEDNAELEFLFCLHVGTSAPEVIMENRREFMDGRADTLKKALQPGGPHTPMLEGIKGDVGDLFFHFNKHNFATLVMKGHKNIENPKCEQEGLLKVPPKPNKR